MKTLGKLGNVEFTRGVILTILPVLMIDGSDRKIEYHLILPFLAMSYTYYKPIKKNKYYDEQ